MQTIVFAGGGTAGHVMPNIALINELKSEYNCVYVGWSTPYPQKQIEEKYDERNIPTYIRFTKNAHFIEAIEIMAVKM